VLFSEVVSVDALFNQAKMCLYKKNCIIMNTDCKYVFSNKESALYHKYVFHLIGY